MRLTNYTARGLGYKSIRERDVFANEGNRIDTSHSQRKRDSYCHGQELWLESYNQLTLSLTTVTVKAVDSMVHTQAGSLTVSIDRATDARCTHRQAASQYPGTELQMQTMATEGLPVKAKAILKSSTVSANWGFHCRSGDALVSVRYP